METNFNEIAKLKEFNAREAALKQYIVSDVYNGLSSHYVLVRMRSIMLGILQVPGLTFRPVRTKKHF